MFSLKKLFGSQVKISFDESGPKESPSNGMKKFEALEVLSILSR